MNVTELIGQRALLQTVAKGYSSVALVEVLKPLKQDKPKE